MRRVMLGELLLRASAELCGRNSDSREDSRAAFGIQLQISMLGQRGKNERDIEGDGIYS
jgi:hypothetical protein